MAADANPPPRNHGYVLKILTVAHFKVPDDAKIRNMLHLCKFDVDKAKERIDNYYTFRTKYSGFFSDSNPKLPVLKTEMDIV